MSDVLTAPEPTPPTGTPAVELPPLPDGHDAAQAAGCGYCQSVRDWWNETRRG